MRHLSRPSGKVHQYLRELRAGEGVMGAQRAAAALHQPFAHAKGCGGTAGLRHGRAVGKGGKQGGAFRIPWQLRPAAEQGVCQQLHRAGAPERLPQVEPGLLKALEQPGFPGRARVRRVPRPGGQLRHHPG